MNFPTRQEFEAWLRSLPPEQEVAPRWYEGMCCPIATFMKTLGYKHIDISPAPEELNAGIYWDDVDGSVEFRYMPKWANEFALRADDWASSKTGFAPITAARALVLLEGIDDA